MPKIKTVEKEKFIAVLGRRKEATARVRLFTGKGENIVNGKPINEYFPGTIAKSNYLKPFDLTETTNKYHITVICTGGGNNGQLEATMMGVARALAKAEPEKYKPVMKLNGLLTRDSRTRQRRNVGMGGKSRRKKQSPKR